jgi:hypothetical protein
MLRQEKPVITSSAGGLSNTVCLSTPTITRIAGLEYLILVLQVPSGLLLLLLILYRHLTQLIT